MKRLDAVYAIIYDKKKNQVLMVHNKDVDTWTLPGGTVENNETLYDALVREVKEETGLLIEPINVAAINERFFKDKDLHVLFITFNVRIVGGTIKISHPLEIDIIKWLDIAQANKLMPYHINGILPLIDYDASYTFQE